MKEDAGLVLGEQLASFAASEAEVADVDIAVFADKSATGVGTDGVFFGGGWGLFADQVVAVAAVLLFSGVVSWIIAVGIDKTVGLRVSAEDELVGLDQTQHAEAAYQS